VCGHVFSRYVNINDYSADNYHIEIVRTYKLMQFHCDISWCMEPTIKLKLMAAQDSKVSVTLPCPLAVSQLVSLPADYSRLINQLSTFS